MAAEHPNATFTWADPPRPWVPPRDVRATVDDFVLNDGTKARARIQGAGRSMLVTFVDSGDEPLPGSPVELNEDFSQSAGRISILGHSAPARRLRIAENAGHDGLIRVFVVYGCSSVRFFQYVRSEVSLHQGSAGGDVLTSGREWRLDSGSPYRCTFTSEELIATGMLDGPGTAPDFDPFEAVMQMAQADDGEPAEDLADDAVFTLAHEFETLPYADGVLLGSIRWGYTLTWTLADAAAGPVPRPVTPVWRPPENTERERSASLGTSWNPRVTSRAR